MSKISKDYIIFDCEVFPHWWCIVFSTLDGFKTIYTSDNPEFSSIYRIIDNYILTGFNIKNYDMKILDAILKREAPERIYKLSKNIISETPDVLNGISFWNKYLFTDLFDDWKNGSLKEYESNKGMSILESEISFDKEDLTKEDKFETIKYCVHDVDATLSLFHDRLEYLSAKLELAELFKINPYKALKSTNAKLAATILEAVPTTREICEIYVLPPKAEKYIKENLPSEIIDKFRVLNNDEKVFEIYENTVVFGIGGIHSTYCNNLVTKKDDKCSLINIDVTSYYPNLLMMFNYMSRNVSKPELYKNIYELRKKLKKDAAEELRLNGVSEQYKKLQSAQLGLKLILNTVYGAMKNQYNALYDPYMAGSLCYTGQLLLASLANKLYNNITGIKIIQTNTDGILVKIPNDKISEMKTLVTEWENMVEFTMEYDYIDAFYQRDVNNYIEVTGNPKKPYKLKGKWSNQAFIEDISSNLNAPITHKALLNYYTENIPIEETIMNCDNILEFCFTTKTGRSYAGTYYENDGKFVKANKVNRVVATTNKSYGTIYKYKVGDVSEIDPTLLDSNEDYDKKLKAYKKKKDAFEEKYNLPFGRMDKAAEIPFNCELINDEPKMISTLDKSWYIKYCNDKIKELVNV